MKICMVTDTFWPRINGVSVSITTLTESLRELGQEVYIVAPDYSQLPSRRQFIDGATIPTEGVIHFPAHSLLFFPEDCSINLLGRESIQHVQLLRSHDFDIIHTHTPLMLGIMALYWHRGKRASGHMRMVHTFHTLFEDFIPCYFPFCYLPSWYSRRFAHWFSMNAFHWYCNHFDQVIAPSTQVNHLLQSYHISPPIKVIPTGIQTKVFGNGNGRRIRKAWGFGDEDKLLLFVGRVGFEKGIDLLINALPMIKESVPHIKLVIVGQGPAEGSLKTLADKLEITSWVRFVGYKPHKEMADIYAAADLFLFASQTESQGLVTVEAMASGTPVVAVQGPGTLDLLENETGGLLSPPEPAAFATQVVRLLTDADLYAQTAKEATRRAQNFSSHTMAKQVLSTYETLLDRQQ